MTPDSLIRVWRAEADRLRRSPRHAAEAALFDSVADELEAVLDGMADPLPPATAEAHALGFAREVNECP